MTYYPTIVTILGILAFLAVALGIETLVVLSVTRWRSRVLDALHGLERHVVGWAWGVALIATAGSLYFSEVAHFIPCSLCWYQRIAMYPLVFVLGVGMIRGEASVWRYGLPLAVVGLGIALYHIAIQWMPSLDVGVCAAGVPCSGRYLAVFGFISIPTLAATAFFLIGSLLLLLRALERAVGDEPAAA